MRSHFKLWIIVGAHTLAIFCNMFSYVCVCVKVSTFKGCRRSPAIHAGTATGHQLAVFWSWVCTRCINMHHTYRQRTEDVFLADIQPRYSWNTLLRLLGAAESHGRLHGWHGTPGWWPCSCGDLEVLGTRHGWEAIDSWQRRKAMQCMLY